MTQKEMDKLIQHYDTYFEQTAPTVIHPTVAMEPHVDALLYPPTEKYPFWKLASMGASDYKMPAPKNALGDRNEYMMFIDSSVDMKNRDVQSAFYAALLEVAHYPVQNKTFISYGHSLEWTPEEGEEMEGAYLEFPQAIESTGLLRCRLGLLKQAICLQVVLLTRAEIEKLLKIGSEAFSYFLYPEDETAPRHFLCELSRSDQF